MKIALINPPDITVVKGICLENRFFIGAPLGLAYLAAVLEEAGCDVQIIDCVGSKLNWDQTCKRLEKSNPDLVGITTCSITLQSALELSKKSKEYFPKVPVVLGGHGIFRIEDIILRRVKEVDVIVRGEGEETIIELAKTIQEGGSLRDVLGISFRSVTGQTITNPNRPFIQNLDSIPFPSRHLLPMEAYIQDYNWAGLGNESFRGTLILSSRGCPFTCTFCQATRYYGHKWRPRSPENVIEEIEHLYKTYKKLGLTGFDFADDNFLANRNRAIKICEMMIDRGLDHLHWTCMARVDSADRILYSKMYEAGCRLLGFGVESGDDRILKSIQKGITKDMVRKAVKMAKEVGLKTWGYFMLGLPGETDRSLMSTLRFSEEAGFDDVTYFPTVLLPGSEMGKEGEIDWLSFIVEEEMSNDPYPNVNFVMKLHPCAPTYIERKKMIKILNYVAKRRRVFLMMKKKLRTRILTALRHPLRAMQITKDFLFLDREKFPDF